MRQAVHLLLCLAAIFLPAAASDVPGTFDPDAPRWTDPNSPKTDEWTPAGTSTNGTCGRETGETCGVLHGYCCGPGNECGVGDEYCRTGCQPNFGICDNTASAETGEAVSFQLTTFTTNNCLPPVSSITSSFDGYNATCPNIEYSKDLSMNTRGRGTCHGHYLKFLYYDSIGCIGKQVGSGFGIRDQCTPLPNRGYPYQSIWVRCSSPPLEQHCVFLNESTGEGDECNSKPAKNHDDDGYEGVYVIGEIPMASSTENASTATSSDFSTTTETDTGADTSASSSGEQPNDAEENKESSATCSSTSRAIIFAIAIFSIQ